MIPVLGVASLEVGSACSKRSLVRLASIGIACASLDQADRIAGKYNYDEIVSRLKADFSRGVYIRDFV